MLAMAFETAGHQADTASGAAEAIEKCSRQEFDLILSDVLMPVMDGHQMVRALAGKCPRTRVILMSGFDGGCESCPYSTRCRLIPKPFRAEQAIRAVAEALSGPPPSLSGEEGG